MGVEDHKNKRSCTKKKSGVGEGVTYIFTVPKRQRDGEDERTELATVLNS